MLNVKTFTMDVILKYKIKPIYIRQSSGTVLININEQKKKQNYTAIVPTS